MILIIEILLFADVVEIHDSLVDTAV